MAQVGAPGETPPLLRMPLADMYAGIHGVAAINAALFGRAASGRGQHIDLALYDCMVSMHDFAVQRYFLSGGAELPQQTGSGQPDSDRLRRVPGEGRQSGDRRPGGRRLESSSETDRRRGVGGGRAVRETGGSQRPLAPRRWKSSAPGRSRSRRGRLPRRARRPPACPAAPVQTIDEVVSGSADLSRGACSSNRSTRCSARSRCPTCRSASRIATRRCGSRRRCSAKTTAASRLRLGFSHEQIDDDDARRRALRRACGEELSHERPLRRDRQPDRPEPSPLHPLHLRRGDPSGHRL